MSAIAVPTTAAIAVEPARRERIRLIVVLGSLIAIGPLTIDMYLPALPTIAAQLHASAAAVQLTLTGSLVGLAIGQLFIGPLSDAVGRRTPLITGLVLHVVTSILCVVAPNVGVLGALRVLQGLGMAAASVVASAVVRDKFSGSVAAQVFSRLLLVMGAAPVLAPALGGELLRWTQWRGVFVALALLGLVLIAVAAFLLPETLPPSRRRNGGVAGTLRTYASLLRDRTFVGLILVNGFGMVAMFAYISGSSFVFQNQYGLDEQQFGLVFGAGAASLIAATQLNVRLLARFTPQQVVRVALAAGASAGLLLVGLTATGLGGLPAVLVALWAVLASVGLTLPNVSAIALTRHGEAAGTAAALIGSIQFGLGALSAPVVGAIGTGGTAMGVVVAGGMLLALLALLVVVRPARLGSLAPAPAVATR